MNWQMIVAMTAVLAALSGFYRWATRNLIREELAALRQDVEVLRLAVFNHLSHGQRPTEARVRKVLGYGARAK